ncbi:WbqC family protein [Nostoc sp. TCL240-02]|uniref:WbqC family protein n=1 Tax=Nostoc sp. TCL240-02 TaxID=2572090 RepID=UPI00157F9142|nr:WbqC family protein [Nostoc sp. TCL240-02]QKQ73552.1 WbqC family protein [Nostoc sp. TCL240-02]
MILTAHQPVYLPWLGLIHKILLADVFCVFDIVQYQKKDYNNRNKIKTDSGEMWLSVPVESKDHFNKKICDIKIINDGWNRKHFKSIYLAYKKSAYFDLYIDSLEVILIKKEYKYLTELNFDILTFMLKSLDIDVPIIKASDYDFTGYKSELVLDMCVKLNVKKYIFGSQGRDYANIQSFKNNGIEVYFQDYKHPIYKQLHGNFVPYMSLIDILFNEGPKSKEIILFNNVLSLAQI